MSNAHSSSKTRTIDYNAKMIMANETLIISDEIKEAADAIT